MGDLRGDGETFRSPMGRKERIIVTRDKQRIKERILYHVLDGFNPDAGPTSRAFLDVCEIRSNPESGKVLGIQYAGMDVIVTKRAGKGFRETKNDNVRSSEEFKRFQDRVETMKGEFAENTSSSVTRSIISEVVDLGRPEWDTVLTVEARSREELDDTLGDVRRNLQGNLEEEIFSEQEKRELGGLLNVTNNRVGENEVENKQTQIEAFEKEIESYSGKAPRSHQLLQNGIGSFTYGTWAGTSSRNYKRTHFQRGKGGTQNVARQSNERFEKDASMGSWHRFGGNACRCRVSNPFLVSSRCKTGSARCRRSGQIYW